MASDSRDYKLDLSSAAPAGTPADTTPSAAGRPRGQPFLCVHFACCGVYTRIFRNADASAYRGRCPRCGQMVSFRIDSQGTEARFFVVH